MKKQSSYYPNPRHRYPRKKKPIFRNRFFWFFIAGIIILCGFFYLFIFSPVFQIRTIIVQGAHFIDAVKIKQEAERIAERNILFFPTKSIFLLNKKEVKDFVLENFFPAKQVIVKKKLLHQLLIKIQEREAKAVCCVEEECFLVDEQGFAFQPISQEARTEEMPLIYFENQISPKDKVLDEEILGLISLTYIKLKQEDNMVIQEFKVFPSKFEAKTADGWTIHFSSDKDIDRQIEDLFLLLKDGISPIEYVDLTFEKIFYK